MFDQGEMTMIRGIFKGLAVLALMLSVSACVTDDEYIREKYIPPVQMNAFLDDKPAMARKIFLPIFPARAFATKFSITSAPPWPPWN